MLANVFDPSNMPRIYIPTGVEGSDRFAQNCKKIALIYVAITSIAATGSFFAGLVTAKTALYTITSISAGILSISVMVNEFAQKNWYPPAQTQTEDSGSGRDEGKSAIIEIDTEQLKQDTEKLRQLIFSDNELSEDELAMSLKVYEKSRPHPSEPPVINGKTPLYRLLNRPQIKNPKLVELLLERSEHYTLRSREITENNLKTLLDNHESPGSALHLIIKHSPNRQDLLDYLGRIAMVDDNSLRIQNLSSGSRNIARNVVLDFVTWQIQNALPYLTEKITSEKICRDIAGIIAQYFILGIDPNIADKILQDHNQHRRQINV